MQREVDCEATPPFHCASASVFERAERGARRSFSRHFFQSEVVRRLRQSSARRQACVVFLIEDSAVNAERNTYKRE